MKLPRNRWYWQRAFHLCEVCRSEEPRRHELLWRDPGLEDTQLLPVEFLAGLHVQCRPDAPAVEIDLRLFAVLRPPDDCVFCFGELEPLDLGIGKWNGFDGSRGWPRRLSTNSTGMRESGDQCHQNYDAEQRKE